MTGVSLPTANPFSFKTAAIQAKGFGLGNTEQDTVTRLKGAFEEARATLISSIEALDKIAPSDQTKPSASYDVTVTPEDDETKVTAHVLDAITTINNAETPLRTASLTTQVRANELDGDKSEQAASALRTSYQKALAAVEKGLSAVATIESANRIAALTPA